MRIADSSRKLGALSSKREPGTRANTCAHSAIVCGVSLGTLLNEPNVSGRQALDASYIG
jgi:hypothetical protein